MTLIFQSSSSSKRGCYFALAFTSTFVPIFQSSSSSKRGCYEGKIEGARKIKNISILILFEKRMLLPLKPLSNTTNIFQSSSSSKRGCYSGEICGCYSPYISILILFEKRMLHRRITCQCFYPKISILILFEKRMLPKRCTCSLPHRYNFNPHPLRKEDATDQH